MSYTQSLKNANPRKILITGFDSAIDVGPIVAFKIIKQGGELLSASDVASGKNFKLFQESKHNTSLIDVSHMVSKIFDGFDTGDYHWIYADKLQVDAGFLPTTYAIEIIFDTEE
ncbi:MAG: hypothetical protein WC175_04075 [Candidatus Dojkabacteria bacterium]